MEKEKAKLKVGFVTSPTFLKTGFSTHTSALLPYLYKTGKYEIFHLNQSVAETPEFQRYPWTCQPAIREDLIDNVRFQNPSEEAYRRHVAYGNAAVEDFIISNKLDVLIHIEDGWSSEVGSYLGSKWFPFMKDNFLQHTTIDSLPILPLYREYAEKCPNMWVWASFAERALKELGDKYSNVKTVHGSLNTDEFYPLSKDQKLALRKEFGIDPECKIFIQLGRNQLRKLFPSTLKSFSQFKQKNPRVKAKLYFHCSWQESGGGWPLERLIKDYKLSNSDVLTTYFCQDCGKWQVKEYEGEGKGCPYCKAKNRQITAGVTSTVTNEDLSKIYGICDASISVFTSGGFEYTSPQSLLCGLPLLCSDYSSGEDFAHQDFVFRCDGSFSHEVQTGFEKFTPNTETMVSFYERICSLSDEDLNSLGKVGRKWALEKFDIKCIGKSYEDWLDSRKPHGWDFKYQPEPDKKPDAIIPEIADNFEWLVRLYKDILIMDVDEKDSGVIFWMSELNSKRRSRQEILDYFRFTAKDSQDKKARQSVKLKDLIDSPKERKTYLLVVPESAGDIFNFTSLLPSIKETNPFTDLYVACKDEFVEILLGNPYIYKVIPFHPSLENEISMTSDGYFDYYTHVTVNTQKVLSYISDKKIAFNLKK